MVYIFMRVLRHPACYVLMFSFSSFILFFYFGHEPCLSGPYKIPGDKNGTQENKRQGLENLSDLGRKQKDMQPSSLIGELKGKALLNIMVYYTLLDPKYDCC